MKVAIPLFGSRVSPHFMTAPEILVIQIDGGNVCSSWKVPMGNIAADRRKTRILAAGPNVLLCGGMDEETRRWFERQGIEVTDNLMGDAMEILKRYVVNNAY